MNRKEEQLELPDMPKKKFANIPEKNFKQIQYLQEKQIRGGNYIIVGNRPVSLKAIIALSKAHGKPVVMQIISELSQRRFRTSSNALLTLVDELMKFNRWRNYRNGF